MPGSALLSIIGTVALCVTFKVDWATNDGIAGVAGSPTKVKPPPLELDDNRLPALIDPGAAGNPEEFDDEMTISEFDIVTIGNCYRISNAQEIRLITCGEGEIGRIDKQDG